MVNDENIKRIKELQNSFMIFSDSEILSIDVSDIYESSREIVNIIDNLMVYKNTNEEDLIEILISISTHLDHIKWHHESIKKIIDIPE